MNELEYTERRAMELKYLGYSYADIAKEVKATEGTLAVWFSHQGKLAQPYAEFVLAMNERRQKDLEDKFSLSDEEVFALSTNVVRVLAKQVQGEKIPVLREDGTPALDAEGKPMFTIRKAKISVRDFVEMWKIQRTMKGLPTTVARQEVISESDHSTLVMKALNLTEDDFAPEQIAETSKRIGAYLSTGKDIARREEA